MSKPFFHSWEKEKDVQSALLRFESKNPPKDTKTLRIQRLLQKDRALLRFIAFSCETKYDYGKWFFRHFVTGNETPSDWMDINGLLLRMAKCKIIKGAVVHKDNRAFFKAHNIIPPAKPTKTEPRDLTEPFYENEEPISMEDIDRCVTELKTQTYVTDKHEYFSFWLRGTVGKLLGRKIGTGPATRNGICDYIHAFGIYKGRWYGAVEVATRSYPITEVTLEERVEHFSRAITRRGAISGLLRGCLSENVEAMPSEKHYLVLMVPLADLVAIPPRALLDIGTCFTLVSKNNADAWVNIAAIAGFRAYPEAGESNALSYSDESNCPSKTPKVKPDPDAETIKRQELLRKLKW